jgi:hypothetical protein
MQYSLGYAFVLAEDFWFNLGRLRLEGAGHAKHGAARTPKVIGRSLAFFGY